MDGTNKPRFDDNDGEGFDLQEITEKNKAKQGEQPVTSQDITGNRRTEFDETHMGDGVGIGNESYEEDGGSDLGFGETDETEDKDRDSPLRRKAGGGSTADGRNE